MKLYHIQAEDGESDWFVVADDVGQAVSLYADGRGVPCDDAIGEIRRVRIILPDVSGTPFSGSARLVDWDDLEVVLG